MVKDSQGYDIVCLVKISSVLKQYIKDTSDLGAIGKPGAFSRKLTYNSVTSVLRQDYETCDTQVFIEYTIINDKMLKMLNGRYYYDAHGDLHLLDYK